MKKTINVVAAILHHDQKIFIAERGYGEFAGLYEFPGGKVEPGEDGKQAIARELKEELDMDIVARDMYYHAHYEYPTFILEMDCYLCELTNPHFELLEHNNYRWILPSQKDEIDWVPADIQIIEEIERRGF